MAFTPEDGTGVVGANSYTTVAYADAYFADRGNVAWSGEDDVKQQWLIQATDYVEGRFKRRFIGYQLTQTQGLHFPAKHAWPYDENVVPDPLQKAICEYAVRVQNGQLAPDPTIDSSGYSVVQTMRKIGPIQRNYQVVGATTGQPSAFRPYPAADMLIGPLIKPGYSGNSVIR